MLVRKHYFLGILLGLVQGVSGQGGIETSWLPVSEAERAQKAPLVDKTAGVEAIFWRVHVWDEFAGGDMQRNKVNYVRLKIFNEEGKKKISSIEIPFRNDVSITAIDGRTIQPDGTIVPLKKEDIHEKDIVRVGGLRFRAKSFAMPAVAPGAIVEYRVREVSIRQGYRYLQANIQQEYPIQKITYFVKPLSQAYVPHTMRVWPFNCKPTPLHQEMNGFSSTSVTNLPAYQPEPYMIGEDNVRAWVLFFYSDNERRDPAKYWEKEGKEVYNRMKESLRVNDEIKQAAAKAVEGIDGEQEKVVALIGYLRKNIRSLFDPSVTEAERGKLLKSMPKERNRTSAEVFKSGIAMAHELNTLFAAMTQAVGMEARPARVGDRDGVFFDPQMTETYFLDNIDMAVKIGGKWKLFDASTRKLPPNMVSWREEGTQALIADPKKPEFIPTPFSSPGESVTIRRARFNLSEDGTLEGEVSIHFTGHTAADGREGKTGDSPEKQQEEVKELVTGPYPSAEVTAIKVENVTDTSQPLTYSYHVKIPSYAQRTGKRLLFSPLYFQQGATPRFSASERKYPIAFRHAWREDDQIHIKLPAGFKLDNSENPGNLSFGKPGEYQLIMRNSTDGEFSASRMLEFGREGIIFFDTKAYPALKSLFEEIHRRDGTTLSLKQEVAQ